MNFSVYNYKILPVSRVYSNFSPAINTYPLTHPYKDTFHSENYLDKLLNRNVTDSIVEANPVIKRLLDSKNIKPKADIDNFNKTVRTHCIETSNRAAAIYNFLPADLKSEANLNYIKKGAELHDIGKIFIPAEILNKNGRLTPKETEIVHLHSKLGEAMLASQNIEPEVLNIVKYHHQNIHGSGYPEIKNSLSGYDINTQITSLADKYTALTERRAYKSAKSDKEALAMLKEEVNRGQINPRLFNALEGCINNVKG